MIEYSDQKTIDEIVTDFNAVVIIYYANWCMPCKSILKSLIELKTSFNNSIKLITLNVDTYPNIALKHNAVMVPTLHYYKNGNIYLKESGFRTRDQLLKNMNALVTLNEIV